MDCEAPRHHSPNVTLTFYAHALEREETDLSSAGFTAGDGAGLYGTAFD